MLVEGSHENAAFRALRRQWQKTGDGQPILGLDNCDVCHFQLRQRHALCGVLIRVMPLACGVIRPLITAVGAFKVQWQAIELPGRNRRPTQEAFAPLPWREYMQRLFQIAQTHPHRHASALYVSQGIGLPLHGKCATAFLQATVQRLLA
ncbi:hypothetical protein D3C84_913290 [compost metagenome]